MSENLQRRSYSAVPSPFKNAVAVVDTPMRKIELLETFEGMLVARATEYRGNQAFVIPIHLAHPEAIALADAIYDTENPIEIPAGPISNHKDIIMHAEQIVRDGDWLECGRCGDLFKVKHAKRWGSDLERAIDHMKRYHPKAKAA
jgi:hypothetical protein